MGKPYALGLTAFCHERSERKARRTIGVGCLFAFEKRVERKTRCPGIVKAGPEGSRDEPRRGYKTLDG